MGRSQKSMRTSQIEKGVSSFETPSKKIWETKDVKQRSVNQTVIWARHEGEVMVTGSKLLGSKIVPISAKGKPKLG